jgi:hypothetical protein
MEVTALKGSSGDVQHFADGRFRRETPVDLGSLLSTKPSIRPSIGTENPIPEEMDHREIAVRVPVMNEVQFLFASEPCKLLKPRSLYVVFLVEKTCA